MTVDDRARPTIEAWFTERLLTQRQASPRTVAAYRGTLSMLLVCAQTRTGKAPSQLHVVITEAISTGRWRRGQHGQRPGLGG
ncbi:MAG: hypothetical protein ACRDOK_04055 [Streptosporangiaceae bacterium]